jgi:hypothetical protein
MLMKRLMLAVVGVGVLVGLGFYVRQRNTPAISAAEPETMPDSAGDGPQALGPDATGFEPPAQKMETPSITKPSPRPVVAGAAMKPVVDTAFVSRTVDVLVSPQSSFEQKREAWKQLRESGKLDQAIADLEQRTADDPRVAEYPATLGQAYLKKCGTIQDMREQGILAMQADKLFDTALSLDPSNWDARFTKAVGLSYWPPMLNKSEEVIQHFQTLIQQQETQAPQPQFADTYAWLGEQYQKAGRGDDARAVWQRGVALFPADEKLQAKMATLTEVK